jgi:DinB family protein
MEPVWPTALWPQFGAAIDQLESALVTCPPPLWTQRLWRELPDHPRPPGLPPEFAEFWYVVYHTIFWFDLYLSGSPEEEFTPPAPFIWTEVDPVAVSPDRPYTKEELHTYLAATRRTCRATLLALTEERAQQTVEYPWAEGKTVTYLELQLYNMRHVQEHAAQLNLFLGQQAIPVPNTAPRAKDEPGSR